MAGNAGKRSYADRSITGKSGGVQCLGSDSSPSMSGKYGTPAMSVASSKARHEEPMVDEEGGGDWGSSAVGAG